MTDTGDGAAATPDAVARGELAHAIETRTRTSRLAVERSMMHLKEDPCIGRRDFYDRSTHAGQSVFCHMIRASLIRVIRRLAVAIAVALVVGPSVVRAQTTSEGSVRATVDSFFSALQREKWDSAATRLDLKQFESYFKGVVGNVRSAVPQPPPTVEDLMAMDSTMPRAVAEWQLGKMKQNGGDNQFAYLSAQFAGVATPRELFALTIPAAAARWLEAQDERRQMREAWRQAGCPISELPSFPPINRKVLGVAVADDSTAYVIHTDDRFGNSDLGEFWSLGTHVMRLRRRAGTWRIEPHQDMLQPPNVGFGFDCPKGKRP